MTLQKDPERNEIHHLRTYINFSKQRVLEVGCGEGRLTWQYAKWTERTIGVDLDHDSLRIAKVDRPYDIEDKVHLACVDSHDLPFPDQKFDLVILAWSL